MHEMKAHSFLFLFTKGGNTDPRGRGCHCCLPPCYLRGRTDVKVLMSLWVFFCPPTVGGVIFPAVKAKEGREATARTYLVLRCPPGCFPRCRIILVCVLSRLCVPSLLVLSPNPTHKPVEAELYMPPSPTPAFSPFLFLSIPADTPPPPSFPSRRASVEAEDFSELKRHTMPINFRNEGGASLHPGGKRFIAGGSDLWVRVFDFDTGAELECLKASRGRAGV